MRDEKGRAQKIRAEIRHFFQVYKTLEEKSTEIIGWSGAAVAEQPGREAQGRYQKAPTR